MLHIGRVCTERSAERNGAELAPHFLERERNAERNRAKWSGIISKFFGAERTPEKTGAVQTLQCSTST